MNGLEVWCDLFSTTNPDENIGMVQLPCVPHEGEMIHVGEIESYDKMPTKVYEVIHVLYYAVDMPGTSKQSKVFRCPRKLGSIAVYVRPLKNPIYLLGTSRLRHMAKRGVKIDD